MKTASKKTTSKSKSKSAPPAPPASAPSAPSVVVRDVFNNNVSRSRSHLINDAILTFGAQGARASDIERKAQELATSSGALGRDGAPLIIRAVRNHLLYLLARERVIHDATAQTWRASDTILKQVGAVKSKKRSKKSK